MRRRDLISLMALAPAIPARMAVAQEKAERATRGLPSPKIKDVSVIATQPGGSRLVVVKITTDQDGLFGYGCATFTQRADLVVPAVEKYLRPFLIGKPADRIEDTWQSCYDSSYWKNGPVLNNAISGVDQALWDIKGRMAGMPVYQLLGGKCREARIPDSRPPRYKWVLAPHHLKAGQSDFIPHQCGVDFVKLELVCPGLGSMLSETVICNGEPATGLKRVQESLQHRVIIREVVVRVHDQNPGQPVAWQFWIVHRPFNDFNIQKLEHVNPCVQPSHGGIRDIFRKHLPFRADHVRQAHRVVARACPYVSYPISLRNLQSSQEIRRLLVRFPVCVTGLKVLQSGRVSRVYSGCLLKSE